MRRNAANNARKCFVAETRSYLRTETVSRELEADVLEWVDTSWAVEQQRTQQQNLIQQLPADLQERLVLHLTKSLFENLSVVSRVPLESRDAIISALARVVTFTLVRKDTLIATYEELVAGRMFIVVSGRVRITSGLGMQQTATTCRKDVMLVRGDFFGSLDRVDVSDADMQEHAHDNVRVIADRTSELALLTSDNYEAFIPTMSPNVQAHLRNVPDALPLFSHDGVSSSDLVGGRISPVPILHLRSSSRSAGFPDIAGSLMKGGAGVGLEGGIIGGIEMVYVEGEGGGGVRHASNSPPSLTLEDTMPHKRKADSCSSTSAPRSFRVFGGIAGGGVAHVDVLTNHSDSVRGLQQKPSARDTRGGSESLRFFGDFAPASRYDDSPHIVPGVELAPSHHPLGRFGRENENGGGCGYRGGWGGSSPGGLHLSDVKTELIKALRESHGAIMHELRGLDRKMNELRLDVSQLSTHEQRPAPPPRAQRHSSARPYSTSAADPASIPEIGGNAWGLVPPRTATVSAHNLSAEASENTTNVWRRRSGYSAPGAADLVYPVQSETAPQMMPFVRSRPGDPIYSPLSRVP